MKKYKSFNKRGFTLTELIAVLVIMALAAVIAVPNVIGFANKYKETNCHNGVERLLTTIQNQTAAGRYTDELNVSKTIINAIADVDDSVGDVVVKSNMGITLKNYCDNKNPVTVSWKVVANNNSGKQNYNASDTTYFQVTVNVKCLKDNISGTNTFNCGKKSGTDVSDTDALKDFLFNDVLLNDAVKGAYESSDANSLLKAIASAFGIAYNSAEFNNAYEYYDNYIRVYSISDNAKKKCCLKPLSDGCD